jgi:hypothetical protein
MPWITTTAVFGSGLSAALPALLFLVVPLLRAALRGAEVSPEDDCLSSAMIVLRAMAAGTEVKCIK